MTNEAPADCVSRRARRLATGSLLLGFLSVPCTLTGVLGILLATPAIITGHMARSCARRLPANSGGGIALTGLCLGYLSVLLTACLVVIFTPGTFKPRDSALRAGCGDNLKRFGLACKMYAAEHDGRYPSLSPEPGRLMLSRAGFSPEYLHDISALVCPAVAEWNYIGDSFSLGRSQRPTEDLEDDRCYVYLGYALTNDAEVRAFADAYRARPEAGDGFSEDLIVPEGQGNTGANRIYRLREGIERLFIADVHHPSPDSIAPSQIPIVIEWPENHQRTGGYVLYMDGHVQFMPYPGRWPMTKETISMLKSLRE